MKAIFILAVAGASLATVSPAAATITYLQADAGAGACGGSIGCATSQTSIPANPSNSSVAQADAGNTLADGSYADAHAKIVFGHMHLYADAFRASGSDAQSSAQGRVHDNFSAANLMPGLQTVTFTITGSHSDVDHVFGNYAYGYFNFDIYDSVTNQNVKGGVWESTDTTPEATLVETFDLPAGHGYYMHEFFEAATYSSYGVVDVSSYQDTIDTYISTPGGEDVIGDSGHDYAAPVAGGAPEPATWAMMLAGFGLLGGFVRRRRAAGLIGARGVVGQTL